MSASERAAFEAAVVEACQQHQLEHWLKPNYRCCVVVRGRFVKYGSYRQLRPVHDTLKYISQFANGDTSAPRIPRIEHFFNQDYMAYLVLEYIPHISSPGSSDFAQRVAEALQWLRAVPAPDSVTIGPIGGGPARHLIFKDDKAPLLFSSVDAIERYLNRAIKRVHPNSRPDPVSLHNERLVFTQSNMDASNFGIDSEGRTCIFHFDEVGLLPESFASFTVSSKRTLTAVDVAKYLDWAQCSKRKTMALIRTALCMVADPTFGLDKDGMPKKHYNYF